MREQLKLPSKLCDSDTDGAAQMEQKSHLRLQESVEADNTEMPQMTTQPLTPGLSVLFAH